MIEGGIIAEDIISLAYADGAQLSKITWGGYEASDISGSISWISQEDDAVYWTSQEGVGAISYDDNLADWTPEYSYGEEHTKKAYFDSGYTFITPPAALGADLIRHLVNGKPHAYLESHKLPLVQCSDDYPNFSLLIDGSYYQVRSKDYKVQLDSAIDEFDCYLTIRVDQDITDYWVLGQTFMQGFVTIFDNSDSEESLFETVARLGIAVNKDDPKTAISLGVSPFATIGDIQPEMGFTDYDGTLQTTVDYVRVISGEVANTILYSQVGGHYPLNSVFDVISDGDDTAAEAEASVDLIALFIAFWVAVWVGIEDIFKWIFNL
mmetsp:Transcript_39587/g.60541  ORF Transcript_39587/g.60541 Transcript_39587/m.60541 type:complete len:322 (+) Transcript_39587:487-1452(+)